jgi:hypothetical protein
MSRVNAVLCGALLLGCGGPAAPPTTNGTVSLRGSSGSVRIDYQPNVKRVKRETALSALRGVSTEGSTLLFDGSVPELRLLQPGDVLLIEGLVARKVLATDTVGSDFAVLTEQATLGETIRDGRIQLKAGVQFGGGTRRASSNAGSPWDRLAALLVPEAQAQSISELPGLAMDAVKGVFQGWETEFAASPEKGRLNLSIHLTKNVGGFKAGIMGEGYLADFEMETDIEVTQGIIDRLEMTHKQLNGMMNFRWEVSKDSPGVQTGNDRIKLPAALSIPLYELLGGFPLFLEISSAMIIQPAISGGKEYSRGAFRITYDGYQSFRIKQGNIDPDGHVTGDIKFIESQNTSALAPLGMVVAFAAPRIELTFGTSKILDMSGMEKAAERVDRIAEELVKQVFGQEGLDRLKSSLGGNLSLSQAVSNAVASDAAGFVELVTSIGMSHTGMSAIAPCTRSDMHLIVKVGASAQAFGQQIGKVGTEIFKRDAVRIDPPGARLCEMVGPGGEMSGQG